MNEMANFKCSKFASSPVSNLALQKKQKNCKKNSCGRLIATYAFVSHKSMTTIVLYFDYKLQPVSALSRSFCEQRGPS